MNNSPSASAKKGKKGPDAKFFQTTKKGEIHELKSDLNSTNKDKIKDAVKKVIAAMTVGKDVSTLFTDVVKSMQTNDIELKKLVYLYIINYARSQPDKAILVVNTFQKDAKDPSPLVRALAIRTMGCIRVDRITEYLCEPLKQALKDKDPYVRKTAAICTAKLYDINPELVEEQDFLERLRDMISDPVPMVVANAVAALAEISETSGKDVFQINANMLQKLMTALNECTEWGQVFLLDCLSQYQPGAKEAEMIIERVTPRLQHANSAVAMAAIRVIMKYLHVIQNPELEKQLVTQKLPPPLITLLSENKPEIQYVALRNINLVTQKRPDILTNKVQHFFCKYNDPIYVKMEKLEIMIKLASVENVEQVLLEFKEYAQEVDVEFVRKAVRAIGRCAIKIDSAAERCIKVLLELIETKVNYVIQEAIIVIKDIFRKYPNKYESIIATLCQNLETLDEPEAKASMVWIIGEYASRIENAPELLEGFIEAFKDENPQVQLQILTAVVKLFLRRPEDAKEMVGKVLNMATDTSDNPDLRDRGYIYWRLLSSDPEAAQAVVLAEKPVITDDSFQLDVSVLDVLIANISTLASVYHKPPESFVQGGKTFVFKSHDEKGDDEEEEDAGEGEEEEADHDEDGGDGGANERPPDRDDSEDDDEEKAPPAKTKAAGPIEMDILGALSDLTVSSNSGTAASATPAFAVAAKKVVLPTDKGNGLQISSAFSRRNGQIYMDLLFENRSSSELRTFALKFNKNFFGITPGGPIQLKNSVIAPGGSSEATLPLATNGDVEFKSKPRLLQVAIKTDLGVFYFQDQIEVFYFFSEDGQLGQQDFLGKWKSLVDDNEVEGDFKEVPKLDTNTIQQRLTAHNVFFVTKRNQQDEEHLFLSLKIKDTDVLLQLINTPTGLKGAAKSENSSYARAALIGVSSILTQN